MKRIIRTAFLVAAGLLILRGPGLAAPGDYFIGADSKQALEQARKTNPDNYAVNYFLGQIYLAEGNRDAAITAWNAFLTAAPADGRSTAVRERMTLLKLAQARELAQKAVAASGATPARAPGNTIAVTDFKNMGPARLAPFIKGLTAMIISDLAKVPQVRVLERAKIKALIQEMQLGLASGIIDGNTAPKLGQMVQAGKVAWGRMDAPDGDNLKITSIVTEILENTNIKETDAQGAMAQFFELQKQLVFGILEGMGIGKADLPDNVRKAVEKVHTTSVAALIQFGMGVDFLDNKDFAQAKQAFAKAVNIDPGFDLAGDAETATPISDVPVTSDGATEEVAMSTAGSGETEDEDTSASSSGTADKGTDDDTLTADAGDTTTTSTAETMTTDTTTVTDTTTDTSQTVTATETETPLYEGPGHWFVSTILINNHSPAADDVFVGTANAPGVNIHTVHSIVDMDILHVNQDDQFVDFTTGNNTQTVTVNQQMTFTSRYHDQWIEYGYWLLPNNTIQDPGDPLTTYSFTKGWYIDGETYFDTQPLIGSVLYSGDAHATFYRDGATVPVDMSGDFNCSVNFDAASNQVTNFTVDNLAGGGHTASITGGVGNFQNTSPDPYAFGISGATYTINGNTAPYGKAGGTVYDNDGGRYVGGSFGMHGYNSSAAAYESVNGIFIGKKE